MSKRKAVRVEITATIITEDKRFGAEAWDNVYLHEWCCDELFKEVKAAMKKRIRSADIIESKIT